MGTRKRKLNLDNERYRVKLVRLYHDETHLAGMWEGEIPSVNKLTADIHEKRRRVSTGAVKLFKREVKRWLWPFFELLPRFPYYELDLCIWVKTHNSNGTVYQRDASNFVKISEDSICQALMTDDMLHFDVSVHKRNLKHGEPPHWTFVITGRNQENHDNENEIKSIVFKQRAEQGQGFKPEISQGKGKGKKGSKG